MPCTSTCQHSIKELTKACPVLASLTYRWLPPAHHLALPHVLLVICWGLAVAMRPCCCWWLHAVSFPIAVCACHTHSWTRLCSSRSGQMRVVLVLVCETECQTLAGVALWLLWQLSHAAGSPDPVVFLMDQGPVLPPLSASTVCIAFCPRRLYSSERRGALLWCEP